MEHGNKMEIKSHSTNRINTKQLCLPSSSKWVSVPSSSRTEHTILALRKVVHLFTRLRCPPMSLCRQKLHVATRKNPQKHPLLIYLDTDKKKKALTGHTLATMVWIFLVFPLLSVSLSRKKKYNLASLGSVPSGIRWASMKIGSEWKNRNTWRLQ